MLIIKKKGKNEQKSHFSIKRNYYYYNKRWRGEGGYPGIKKLVSYIISS